MAEKLPRNAFPDGHTVSDFEAFGPVVVKDTEFASCRLADLGCFNQDGVDSNKYYHLAAVKSTTNNKWYAYYEWGRTKPDGRPSKPAFQFHVCVSEDEAIKVCEKQFHAKNTKRGKWEKIGSRERFVPKIKKNGKSEDLYVVRPLASRLVGLPCAENIANEDAKGIVEEKKPQKNETKKKKRKVDLQTEKLFRDLLGGAKKYSQAFLGSSGPVTLPSYQSLQEGRDVLNDAMSRLKDVGDDVDAQVKDKDLQALTRHLHGLIPKDVRNAKPEQYILNQNNINRWQDDIDVLETALQSSDLNVEEEESDVMRDMPLDMEWIDPKSNLGEWLYNWWPNASRNRHGYLGPMKIKNMWKVDRHGDDRRFVDTLSKIEKEVNGNDFERPLFQEKKRPDLGAEERKKWWSTNVGLLFHATRSVNVASILQTHFRVPKQLSGVVITGAMFGAFGSYMADDWRKSAGYSSLRGSYWSGGSGGIRGREAFMFACDTILGNPYVAPGPRGFTAPPPGHHSVFGKGGVSQVQNNEFVAVPTQIRQRYLLEFSV